MPSPPEPAAPTVAHAMRAYLARTETFVHNQIATLRRYRPVVVAHHRRPHTDFDLGEGAIAEERLPVAMARLEHQAYRRARVALPPALATLADYLREQDARLLHFHYVTDARFLLGLARRTGLPAIVSAYGYDVSSFPRQWHGLGRRYLRPLFAAVDCFLAMSEDMRDDLLALGCPEDRVRIHYHGSDTTRFRNPERSYATGRPLTVLCCARLEACKGQHLVLDALRRLERRGRDDFRVVLLGEGPGREALERRTAAYGWQDRVTFAGHVPYTSPALIGHFRRADVFAHPSTTIDGLKEGIPGSIVEAMASGLPVVATRHAGIPAVIGHGHEGLLVPERDEDALTCALEALLRDATLRERLGRGAARRAEGELELHARTRRLEGLYDRFSA